MSLRNTAMEACQRDLPWMALPLFRRITSSENITESHRNSTSNCSDGQPPPLSDTSASTPSDDVRDADFSYFDLPEITPGVEMDFLASPSLFSPESWVVSSSQVDLKSYQEFEQHQQGDRRTGTFDFKLADPDDGCYLSEEMLKEIEIATSSSSTGTNSPSAHGSTSTVSCPYPGCKSSAVYSKVEDLRQHYQTHCKRFFCRYPECPQSALNTDPDTMGKKGFATRKDRTRHEAKHKPEIQCQWRGENGEQCGRIFSRVDNMRDHVKRIHIRRGIGGYDMNQEKKATT